MDILSNMAVARSFDSNISMIEQRSLVSFLKNELASDVDKYTERYMHLLGLNDDLTRTIEIFVKGNTLLEKGRKLVGTMLDNFPKAENSINRFVDTKEYKLAVDNFNFFKESFINKYPLLIELNKNDIENSGYNQLQELIVKNSRSNKPVNYIVSGKIGNAVHFFLLEQQGKIVIVKDSVGLERDDFFKTFLEFKSDFGIKYYRISNKLQYSSGVCEVYSIIQMFFDMRLRLFNKPYRDDILSSVIIDESCNKLLAVFSDGLTEASFGTFENFVQENQPRGSSNQTMLSLGHGGAMYDARYKLLKRQIESVRNTSEFYALGEPFKDIFVLNQQKGSNLNTYLSLSLKLLEFLNENMFLLKEEKIGIINNLLVENLKLIPSERVKSAISIILDEGNKLISGSDELVNKIESVFVKKGIIQRDDLVSVLKKYRSDSFADRLAKAVLDSGKVDFSNPRMFIRAGYAYWKTLEYVETFDRRLTKYIVDNENFNDDTKRSMLSVIYSNRDFINVNENDQFFRLYPIIDAYYNNSYYKRVNEILGEERIRFSKEHKGGNFIEEVLLSHISYTLDPFSTFMPHIISWNRRFREDIFRYVSEGNNDDFNQKIKRFFFETEQVNEDYVNIVAKKYTFKNKSLSGEDAADFSKLVLVAEGNDRDKEVFDEVLKKGNEIFMINYSFRKNVVDFVQNTVEIKNINYSIKISPIYSYLIKDNNNLEKSFYLRNNIIHENINSEDKDLNKRLICDITYVLDNFSNSRFYEDANDFASELLIKQDSLIKIKLSLLSSISSNTDTQQTKSGKQQSNKNKKTGQQQEDEELNESKIWEKFKSVVKNLPENENLKEIIRLKKIVSGDDGN